MKRIVKMLSLVCLIAAFAVSLLTGCGKIENKYVTLQAATTSGNQVSAFSIVNPDATLTPFIIPDHRVFIVTDMDITFSGAAASKDVNVQLLRIGTGTTPAFQDAVIADSSGSGGLHASLETGVIIKNTSSFSVSATSSTNPTGIVVNLHGYLC